MPGQWLPPPPAGTVRALSVPMHCQQARSLGQKRGIKRLQWLGRTSGLFGWASADEPCWPLAWRGCHSSAGLWLCQQRVPTFAVLPIPGVAGLADALVGLGGVLADGIDVAVVSSLHTLVNICKRTGEGSRGESLGPLPLSPWEPPPQVMDPSNLWLLNQP